MAPGWLLVLPCECSLETQSEAGSRCRVLHFGEASSERDLQPPLRVKSTSLRLAPQGSRQSSEPLGVTRRPAVNDSKLSEAVAGYLPTLVPLWALKMLKALLTVQRIGTG